MSAKCINTVDVNHIVTNKKKAHRDHQGTVWRLKSFGSEEPKRMVEDSSQYVNTKKSSHHTKAEFNHVFAQNMSSQT